MSRKVEVRDGESIEHALFRLRTTQAYEYKRWSKKRYGYYEKPSALRRKRQKMAKIWTLMERTDRMLRKDFTPRRSCIHLYIGLKDLFARTGPTNQAGR